MRPTRFIPVLIIPLLALTAAACAEPPTINPAAEANEAGWAELDAQARITEGDYDGALQAEHRAEVARQHAEELAAHAPIRSAQHDTEANRKAPR